MFRLDHTAQTLSSSFVVHLVSGVRSLKTQPYPPGSGLLTHAYDYNLHLFIGYGATYIQVNHPLFKKIIFLKTTDDY